MLFRNRRLVRAVACFFLLETVGSLAAPSVALAMSGVSQPEFTSYEAPGSTDMVNLSTGDFSFSVPAIDIPGPERSFSLPLSYNAGIQLEQEASWVGLGWSLNAGAIARSVNGYADDANNEPIRMTYNKAIDRGWTSSIPGVLELGWNSITGHSGSVDLLGLAKVGWDKDGVSEGDLVGIGYSSANGFNVDPVRMATAAYTIATFGAATPFAIAANIGISAGTSALLTLGLHALGVGVLGGTAGFNNQPTREVNNHWWGDNYWNFINNHTTENTFGSLYFGKMSQQVPTWSNEQFDASPVVHYGNSTAGVHVQPFHNDRGTNERGNDIKETAADIYQDGDPRDNLPRSYSPYYQPYRTGENNYFLTSSRPISTAHDNFSVMGEQVSGSIRPFRQDVGSIAYPKIGVDLVDDNNNNNYKLYHYKYMVVPFLDNYKVGFRYENALSNTYTYLAGNSSLGTQPEGFDSPPNTISTGATYYRANDITLQDPRFLSARTETSARKGLATNTAAPVPALVYGKHTVWYSNSEINALYANPSLRSSSSFLEFDTPVTTASSNNAFRESLPPSGIGAFAVTAEDGTTYHYSLPVYQYKSFAESNEIQTSNTIGGLGRSTRTTGESGTTNPNNPSGASATTWLLTAITSADYVDRNNSGTVDAGDWGGWVQFKYGKFSSQYKWRQPYIGTSYTDESPAITAAGYTEGYKETYYLNAIATRTHTALFIKSIREDARGHFRPGVTASTSNLGIDEQKPSSSLRLDEVILLDNATLTQLQTPDAIRVAGDPTPVPALSTATYPTHALVATVAATDHLDNVLDASDLVDWNANGTRDTRVRDFVYSNCIKRTRFNYDYNLCRGVPNSFSFDGGISSLPPMDEASLSTRRGGKLTLESVSFFGPSVGQIAQKIIPDFAFGYGSAYDSNPGYSKEKWDAFGMYSPDGKRSVDSHKPYQSPTYYQAPWSLIKITSPLGGVTEIQYERDQYAHVSEFGTKRIHLSNSDCGATFNTSLPGGSNTGIDLRTVLRDNQTVYVTGKASFDDCPGGGNIAGGYPASRFFNNTPVVISSISNTSSNNQIILTQPLSQDLSVAECPRVARGAELDLVIPSTVTGGDVRVAQITTSTDGASYRVKYRYVEDLKPGTNTSSPTNSTGVLAKEPAFLDRFERPANAMFDYPTTPVIYSKVTVLRGKLSTDSDYDVREEYAFYTPTTDMVSEPVAYWRSVNSQYSMSDALQAVNNQSAIRTGLIGQPKAISTYNHSGQQELLTKLNYTSDVANPDGLAKQGQFSEGLINTEKVRLIDYFNRSTKTYFPSVLSSTQSYRNGVSIKNENALFDFYTGQIVESSFQNSRNEVFHTRTIPAYYKYAEMGAKGDNATNSHMLSQQTAAYTVKEKRGGAAYDPLDFLNPTAGEVISAGIQTWSGTWNNYRTANTGQSPAGYADLADSPRSIWREAATYQWQSSLLNPNGSFANFVDYSWLGGADARWVKATEAVRYDHFSHLLETRDVNGLYNAQKTGYNQSQQLASVNNARFTELAYSGAEDIASDNTAYFGGEVAIGGTVNSDYAHTGRSSVRLNTASDAFIYRARASSSFAAGDVLTSKTYRLSVWVRPATSGGEQNAQLFAASAGTTLTTPSVTLLDKKKAGEWYRLTMNVTLPTSATDVSFGCRNTAAGTLYFDDFRLCPLNAQMTSRVYDAKNNNLTEALDDENLYTRFVYNGVGRLQRVYKESFDRADAPLPNPRLIKEYSYNYGQMYAATWITDVYACVTNSDGNYTGTETRHMIDVNPLNPLPRREKVETNGSSANCAPTACEYFSYDRNTGILTNVRRLRGNNCEEAEGQQPVCTPWTQGGVHGNLISRTWIFPNGDTYDDPGYFSTNSCGDINQQKSLKASTPLPIQAIKRTK